MDGSDKGQATFEVRDSTLVGLTDDLFGLWRVSPSDEGIVASRADDDEEVVFGEKPQVPNRKEQAWSISLPSSPSDAALYLKQRESRLRTVEHNMADLGLHLDELTRVLAEIPAASLEEVAFDVGRAAEPRLVSEESRLKDDLDSLSQKVKPAG